MTEVTTLSMEEVNKLPANGTLYVLNTSSLGNKQTSGRMLLPVIIGNSGRETVISIPNTFIPIELTAYAPLEAIRNSSEFYSFVSKRVLTPINSKEAKAYLQTPEATAELNRLAEMDALERATPSAIMPTKVTIGRGSAAPEPSITPEQAKLTPEFVALVTQFSNGGDDFKIASAIDNMSITVEDSVYGFDNVRNTASKTYLAIGDALERAQGSSFRR